MMDAVRKWWAGHAPVHHAPCEDCGLPEETRTVLDQLIERLDKVIAVERSERNIVDRSIWRNPTRRRRSL